MKELMYEGKAKQIFSTDNPDEVIIHYKDTATAGNGAKKTDFTGKGEINADITTILFRLLAEKNIPTHFIKLLNQTDILCEKVSIIPLEVICRNIATGSLTKRLGITEGKEFATPILELCYKNDDYNDPLINDDHAIILDLVTAQDLAEIKRLTRQINEILKPVFESIDIKLVDFKLEFGLTKDGKVVLADEISPDTCRFWDKKTLNKLDKDRFRQDLGDVLGAYKEIQTRLHSI